MFRGRRKLLILLTVTVISISQSDSQNEETTTSDPSTSTEEEEMTTTAEPPPRNLCPKYSHSSEFSFTCCKGQMYPAGINLDIKFQECYKAPKGLQTTVHDTLWNFYHCLVGDIFKLDNVTLEIFARKYTENYQPEIRDKILERAMKTEPKVASEMHKERYIRNAYHHIEREVCEGEKETDPPAVASVTCTNGRDIYREEIHARGSCCNEKPIPLRIEFLRRPPTEDLRECTSNLMLSVLKNQSYYLGLDFEESDAQQYCLTACTLNSMGLTSRNNYLTPQKARTTKEVETGFPVYNFDPVEAVKSLVGLFAEDTKKKLEKTYEDSWNFTRKIEDSISHTVRNFWKTEFGMFVDYVQLEPLFTMCEAYNVIVRDLEMAIYNECNK